MTNQLQPYSIERVVLENALSQVDFGSEYHQHMNCAIQIYSNLFENLAPEHVLTLRVLEEELALAASFALEAVSLQSLEIYRKHFGYID